MRSAVILKIKIIMESPLLFDIFIKNLCVFYFNFQILTLSIASVLAVNVSKQTVIYNNTCKKLSTIWYRICNKKIRQKSNLQSIYNRKSTYQNSKSTVTNIVTLQYSNICLEQFSTHVLITIITRRENCVIPNINIFLKEIQ